MKFLLILTFLFTQASFACVGISEKDALQNQTYLISRLQAHLRPKDKARFDILRSMYTNVYKNLEANNWNTGHMDVVNAYQMVILSFKHSATLFDKIRSELNTNMIDDLQRSYQCMAKSRGMDKTDLSVITYTIFLEVLKNVEELQTLGISNELANRLSEMRKKIIPLQLKARVGDSLPVLEEARNIALEISSLWTLLDKNSASRRSFEIYLTLHELIDFFGKLHKINFPEIK
jgi:hypothetical protein